MTKISIITINYNDKIGLEKTLKSVTSQTFPEFEFIVIDGGSNDGSKELIEHYANRIDYWVTEPDEGVYNAMNKGIKVATGEFILFMNGGDLFYDNQVLENIQKLLVPEYDIYYGDNYKVKGTARRKKTYPEKLSFSFFYSSSLNHQSTFIRRKLFFDHFLYKEDYKIVADWDFFVYTICKQNVPYKYLNCIISEYDFTGISSSEKSKNIIAQEKEATLQEYFPLFVEDYKQVAELNSKRVQQVLHIKNFPLTWKILKSVISFLLLFTPKSKK